MRITKLSFLMFKTVNTTDRFNCVSRRFVREFACLDSFTSFVKILQFPTRKLLCICTRQLKTYTFCSSRDKDVTCKLLSTRSY